MGELSGLPSKTQAMVNALRGLVGIGAQQSAGPATNVQNAYRAYQEQAMVQGQQPLPLEQWMQQQQQLRSTGANLP